MKNILLISLFLLLSSNIFSQSNHLQQYLPLQKGNIWFYNCQYLGGPGSSSNDRVKVEIEDTMSIDGKLYYRAYRSVIHISGNAGFSVGMFVFSSVYTILKIDSLTGNIYYYTSGTSCTYSPHEIMTDSLNAKLGDLVNVLCISTPYSYTCTDTVTARNYESSNNRRQYVRNVGLAFSSRLMQLGPNVSLSTQTLIGRVINGVVTGDTSFIVGISPISTEIPAKYMLFQNYPNPFNPVTKLKFDIPVGNGRDRSVKLVIYDVLGCELTTLVNEQLIPGTYEVDWDATNYSSGTYFYRLEVGDFIETKKMVLIK